MNLSLLVEEFQLAFGTPTPDLQMKLVLEENDELKEAMVNALKESCDFLYVLEGLTLSHVSAGSDPEKTMKVQAHVNIIKGLLESIWGTDILEEAFKRVHASNMSKLGPDGKPIRREDGKVLKGPAYKQADLTDLIPL
jgi:hypothetical protein